jgi:hypothetical protein
MIRSIATVSIGGALDEKLKTIADRKGRVGEPSRRHGAVQPRRDLRPRVAPVESFDCGAMVAFGHQQALAVDVRTAAPRLVDQRERAAEIRHGRSSLGHARARAPALRQASLDPRRQLLHGRGRSALGGALGQHDFDLHVIAHVYPHPARA